MTGVYGTIGSTQGSTQDFGVPRFYNHKIHSAAHVFEGNTSSILNTLVTRVKDLLDSATQLYDSL
jgi:hypothetical protein